MQAAMLQLLSLYTVQRIAVLPKPILCTKWPKFTMLFYYVKMLGSSSLWHPTLPLTGALNEVLYELLSQLAWKLCMVKVQSLFIII